MSNIKTPSGIYLPTQAVPRGYIELTDVQSNRVLVNTPFVVCVDVTPDEDEYTRLYVTTSPEPLIVSEPFETVMRKLAEAQE